MDAQGKNFLEKARCCLRGDKQLAYIDYDPSNIYAPVASHDAIRLLIAIAAAENAQLEGADVSNAYLYGELDIPIIMQQPTDSSQKPAMPGYHCRLHKSIYGTRQAGEIWGSLLDSSLKSWGFLPSQFDNRIYFFRKGEDFITIAVVVDDLAFASNSPVLMNQVKKNLTACFDVKLFGQLTSFIGWNIIQEKDCIRVNQQGYVESLLKDNGLLEANAVRTPLPLKADVLPAREDEATLDNQRHKQYRSIIGSLLYLAVCTRPDISFSVSVLARQVHAPTARHMALLKRILRFVSGTVSNGLKYPRSVKLLPRSLVAAVDADWGGCKETRKSTSGWIIAVNGALVIWRTRKQTIIATSSAEAEYIALFDYAKHVSWMRKLYWEVMSKRPWPEREVKFEATPIKIDSTAATALAMSKQVSARSKHIDLKYHFVKAALGSGLIVLNDVASKDNPADMLTKILALPVMKHLCDIIHLG